MLVFRSHRLNAVSRSKLGRKCPFRSHNSSIVRNLTNLNGSPPRPALSWENKIGRPIVNATLAAITCKSGEITTRIIAAIERSVHSLNLAPLDRFGPFLMRTLIRCDSE
jgi:hypothetical protein